MKRQLRFTASGSSGDVSAILIMPENAKALYVFAHGAGAPMNHPFMNKAADFLAVEKIATFRYNFPYTENKLKSINPLGVLIKTIHSAVKTAGEYAGDLPIYAGGKSMGGRMTSQAASSGLEYVKGLIFFGFPLHAPGRESTERADHLFNVNIPMLFLQGTRDKLANPDLLKPIITKLGKRAELYMIEGADHSFHVLKSSGKTDDEVLKEITSKAAGWMMGLNY